ncbi:response regulator transcription factor [Streptomyces sp. NPDC058459]|uniref:response regulator transcription factor n=1 Tax=Streptomyces sp. NPDC058459 TaxID=3346508 RepID=UPI00364B8A38
MRVLVVEDEVILAEAVQSGLRREAMAVDVVHSGEAALEQMAFTEYDAVVLDRDLPGMHGDELCRLTVERYPSCRVLMLTAARRLDERVTGLELGADDYLTKPFEFPELVARLRAINRRNPTAQPPQLAFAGLRLDPFRREVYRDGRLVRLTPKEFAVLELLMRDRGGVISAEILLEKAWDSHADPFTNAVRITISTLRAKLGKPALIHTVTGAGYYLAGAAE